MLFAVSGLHRSEFTAGEIAEEMEKERKYLQLTTADYLIKVNEIRTKKSVDLLQYLLEYYKAQYRSVNDHSIVRASYSWQIRLYELLRGV